MKNILLAIFITSILCTFWFVGNYPKAFYYIDLAYAKIESPFANFGGTLAAVLLHKPITISELQSKYNSTSPKKIKILIIPGHEPDYGGTSFGDINERDLNVELANNLAQFLNNNGHYDVMIARDSNNWNPILSEYFRTQWNEIITFFKDNKQETLRLVNTGKTTNAVAKVVHNKARSDVAIRLYGINKWETENAVDIAIHVHFNDYPRTNISEPGEYSGFSIYVPEKQYANSTTTKAIAEKVFTRLSKYNAVSNLPQEDEGIIESPDLIAIGSFNTTNSASVLIEYGYIYEPQIQNSEVRTSTLKDLAFQTYLGLQDFFGSGNDVSFAYDTLMLPHRWNNELSSNKKAEFDDVLALQTALLIDGLYPGNGKTKNECPRTGKIGPCTLGAIGEFQKKYGIKGEEGKVGIQTMNILNQKYSVKAI